MNSPVAVDEVIDLSDGKRLSSDEIDERHAELIRIERKIDALQMRKHVLECELGLELASEIDADVGLDLHLDADVPMRQLSKEIDSQLFLDDSIAAFDAARGADRSVGFEIDDSEFDERFAAFASTDEEGDHAARRWLAK